MAIISIFGLAGTGTSTCGRLLASELDYKFYSTGKIFREIAEENEMTLYEYEKLVHVDHNIDTDFDKRIQELGLREDNFVIDSRLAWFFIPHSRKIKLETDLEIRISRVASRDKISYEEALEKTLVREADHFERYHKIYPEIQDYSADNNFDLVIDSGKSSPDEIVKKIISII